MQRLTDKLSEWSQAGSESQLAALPRQLVESYSFLSSKAKKASELRCQVADLESKIEVKTKTIVGLADQLQYKLKVMQNLVKTIRSPLVGGSFSFVPACIWASSSIFKDVLSRLD